MPKRKKARLRSLDADNGARCQRFLDARHDAGLTQEDVAAVVGVSVTSASRWETDGAIPAGDVLVKVAQLYRKSPAWLIFGSGDPELESEGGEPPYRAWFDFIAGRWPETALLRDWMVPKLRAMRFPSEPEIETYRRAVYAYATIRTPDDTAASS